MGLPVALGGFLSIPNLCAALYLQVRFMYRMTGYLRILWSDERFDSPLYNESCSREFIDVTALKSRLWTPDIYLTNSVKTTASARRGVEGRRGMGRGSRGDVGGSGGSWA